MTHMNDNGLSAAITALLTVGVLLLNLGASMIQSGQLKNGILLIMVGVALILSAVWIVKLMTQNIIKRTLAKGS